MDEEELYDDIQVEPNIGSAESNRITMPNKTPINDYARNHMANRMPQNQTKNLIPSNHNMETNKGINNPVEDAKKKAAIAALQAAGVPAAAGKSLMGTKGGQQALKTMSDPMGAMKDDLKDRMSGQSDIEKEEAAENEKEKQTGQFQIKIPFKIKLILIGIAASIILFIVIFVQLFSGILGDEKATSIALGMISGKVTSLSDKNYINNIVKNDEYLSEISDQLGQGTSDNEYFDRIANLGNLFYIGSKCEKDDCLNRPEVLYYKKIADISIRYKNKYKVNLDWVLLTATSLATDIGTEETMKLNLSNYNSDDIENYDILMNLDWDYDYKNIDGYLYLDRDTFEYDLQILAKNMVTKTTVQTCSNDAGVVETKKDIDVEDMYFERGQGYYLTCSSGQTYNITSTYRLDEEKYNEFLLEYIEHKYYLAGSKTS